MKGKAFTKIASAKLSGIPRRPKYAKVFYPSKFTARIQMHVYFFFVFLTIMDIIRYKTLLRGDKRPLTLVLNSSEGPLLNPSVTRLSRFHMTEKIENGLWIHEIWSTSWIHVMVTVSSKTTFVFALCFFSRANAIQGK